jgi:hypothetical protein
MTAQTRSQSEAAGLAPGSEFAGYRIERLLDRGGMGIVYVATEIDLGRTVALKVIAPEHTCDGGRAVQSGVAPRRIARAPERRPDPSRRRV